MTQRFQNAHAQGMSQGFKKLRLELGKLGHLYIRIIAYSELLVKPELLLCYYKCKFLFKLQSKDQPQGVQSHLI